MWLAGAVLSMALASGAGCGDDAGQSDGTGGKGGTGGSGGAGGSGGGAAVNGCDASNTADMTASSTVTISFAGIEYAPKCVRIKSGTTLIFSGNFASHPLVGGEVVGTTGTPDRGSPIPETNSGTELKFTLMSITAAYPFYCSAHVASGMMGAIFVEK
ncbi:MAG: plastocyanin/azurin family copper-binding protein [Polyangiaceae bacterium]